MSSADDDELNGLVFVDEKEGIRPPVLDAPEDPGGPSAPADPDRHPNRSAPDGVVRLDFPRVGMHLDVPVGGELRLGRDDSWAPQASCLLAGESTVSGQHAVVACTADGTLTVTEAPRGSSNGVRVDSRTLSPGSAERLHCGDTVWLGPWVSFTVQDPMGVLAP